jgi:hypothetical protein
MIDYKSMRKLLDFFNVNFFKKPIVKCNGFGDGI